MSVFFARKKLLVNWTHYWRGVLLLASQEKFKCVKKNKKFRKPIHEIAKKIKGDIFFLWIKKMHYGIFVSQVFVSFFLLFLWISLQTRINISKTDTTSPREWLLCPVYIVVRNNNYVEMKCFANACLLWTFLLIMFANVCLSFMQYAFEKCNLKIFFLSFSTTSFKPVTHQ